MNYLFLDFVLHTVNAVSVHYQVEFLNTLNSTGLPFVNSKN